MRNGGDSEPPQQHSENTYTTHTDTKSDDKESEEEVLIVLKSGLHGFQPSYNIPPTKNSIIIYQNKSTKSNVKEYVFEALGFGLVPSWSQPKDPEPVSKGNYKGLKYSKEIQAHQAKFFNCRKETLAQGSNIWNPVKNQRCVVPIEGYFEWKRQNHDKTPYYIHSNKHPLIYLAGFYSHNSNYKDNFQNPESGYLSTFTIVTGPATKDDKQDLSWLHHRKPIMLLPGTKEWDDWLNPNLLWKDDLLDTCLDTVSNIAYNTITSYKVSKDVGNSAHQGNYLVQEIKNEKSPQKPIDSFFKKRSKPDSGELGSPKKQKIHHDDIKIKKEDGN